MAIISESSVGSSELQKKGTPGMGLSKEPKPNLNSPGPEGHKSMRQYQSHENFSSPNSPLLSLLYSNPRRAGADSSFCPLPVIVSTPSSQPTRSVTGGGRRSDFKSKLEC